MKKDYRPPATGGYKLFDAQIEQKMSNLFLNSPLLKKIMAFFFMPMIHKSGLKINNDKDDFYIEVPPKRFNKNAYGTISGASILSNLELAGGIYLLAYSDSKYRLVCRNVSYSFRRPTKTGLHFKFEMGDKDFDRSVDEEKPFNANLITTVYARTKTPGQYGRQIGKGNICFHLWPLR